MSQDADFGIGEGQSTNTVITQDAFEADAKRFFDQHIPCFLGIIVLKLGLHISTGLQRMKQCRPDFSSEGFREAVEALISEIFTVVTCQLTEGFDSYTFINVANQ